MIGYGKWLAPAGNTMKAQIEAGVGGGLFLLKADRFDG
jgi:hypothetical protein